MSKNNASLLEAARSGDIKRVQTFLSTGASASVNDKDGTTALMFAANSGYTEIVKVLIESGANIDYKRKRYGLTALMLACAAKQVDIVRILIAKGADINAVNEDGSTALMIATLKGYSPIVQALVDALANVNLQDKDGDTALQLAVKQ